jgi:hypothetical protein
VVLLAGLRMIPECGARLAKKRQPTVFQNHTL